MGSGTKIGGSEMRRPDITVQVSRDPVGRGLHLFTKIDLFEIEEIFGEGIVCAVIEKVADHIAKDFIQEHGISIAAKLDPVAIANLVCADAAAKTRELLDKKLPERVEHHVRETVRTEVYQRGVLGGMRRL